jgi:hypothetical protein
MPLRIRIDWYLKLKGTAKIYFLGGVIVLSSCGSEQKEARFWGETAPNYAAMYPHKGCYVAVRSAGSQLCLVSRKSLRYRIEVLFRTEARGHFYFSLLYERLRGGTVTDLRVPQSTGTWERTR